MEKAKIRFTIIVIFLICVLMFVGCGTNPNENSSSKNSNSGNNNTHITENGNTKTEMNTSVTNNYEEPDGIKNPRIERDESLRAGQKVTWSCLWFGYYPQTEIVKNNDIIFDEGVLFSEGDLSKYWEYEVDPETYEALLKATESNEWDENNEIILNGQKYRRVRHSTSYRWVYEEDGEDHYFRYDPIKWRVLETDGKTALILADKALDVEPYHEFENDVTWETSTLRGYLNGFNVDPIDYSKKNFIDEAFSAEQKERILESSLDNPDNSKYGTSGGNPTKDKVFLLSELDAFAEKDKPYGFVTDLSIYDEGRQCKASSFAIAKGTNIEDGDDEDDVDEEGFCDWWLRTPGEYTYSTDYVGKEGKVHQSSASARRYSVGCRPALQLDLSASDLYSFAGSVCSNGTVEEK